MGSVSEVRRKLAEVTKLLAAEHGIPWLNGPGKRIAPGFDHPENCEVCRVLVSLSDEEPQDAATAKLREGTG